MKVRVIAIGACAAFAALVPGGVAEARNPHCAGGIQYVVQGMRDKDKGNTEDYQREMMKAVAQLTQCAEEDPDDFEALGYLGWALAEIDSACPAGQAFEKAIRGLEGKGDKKKATWADQNRESYWAKNFNDGIARINAAQAAYPEFTKEPENEADQTLKGEAATRYADALASLTRASCLKPGDARTIRNLGSIYAFRGEYQQAEAVFRKGLEAAPGDSDLVMSLKMVRTNYANKLTEEKKYDEAIGFFADLIQGDPSNPDLHLGLADTYFKRATARSGEERRADFKLAGDGYAKASELKGGEADLPPAVLPPAVLDMLIVQARDRAQLDSLIRAKSAMLQLQPYVDLLYNSALAYQNAGEWASAESRWRAVLKLTPDDTGAMSALGSCLAELKKYDEGIKVVHVAVNLKPHDKILHRQLGGVYAKANNDAKSTEELMVYLAMQRGTVVPDISNYLRLQPHPATTAAAKTLESLGLPDEITLWPSDEFKGERYLIERTKVTEKSEVIEVTSLPPNNVYETWFFWTRKLAFTFKAGVLVVKSDWGNPGSAMPAPAGGKGK